jgi:hypothetical protein
MASLFYTELNETSAFAEGAIENMSQRAIPVAPEMVSVRSSWKKGEILQARTASDVPGAPESIVEPDASTSSGSGGQHPTSPSPRGSPSTPTQRPLKISRVTTTDTYHRRLHATYAGDNRTYRRRRRNAIRTTNRRSRCTTGSRRQTTSTTSSRAPEPAALSPSGVRNLSEREDARETQPSSKSPPSSDQSLS